MSEPVQFSVTRQPGNIFRVIVQNERTILKSDDVGPADIIEVLSRELAELVPLKKYGQPE